MRLFMQSARLTFRLIHIILSMVLSLYVSSAAFISIVRVFVVASTLGMRTLNKVKLSVSGVILIRLFNSCVTSCIIIIAQSQTSAKPNVSTTSTK